MAKSKQRSAAQRRELTRQQRQQRMNSQDRRRKKSGNNSWAFIAGIIVMVGLVIGAFVLLKQWQNASLMVGADQAQKTIKTVNSGILSTVGPGSAKSTLQSITEPPLQGPSGNNSKLVFLYIGGEYCPFCAAQRWAVINSLSRFGQFGPLVPIISSEQNVPTFTFHNVKYTSQYIDLQAYEQSDNATKPQLLDKVPTEYLQTMAKYDQQGSIPFINIANQQISAGSYYQPDVLIGHSFQDISDRLKDSNSNIAHAIYGTANYLTAAICTALTNQPANVCNDPTIQHLQKLPAKTSLLPGHTGPLTYSALTFDILSPLTRQRALSPTLRIL